MNNNTIATIKNNTELNGIEIYFTVFPINGTRSSLKSNGFRWNHKKGCWYAKASVATEGLASIIADTTIDEYKAIAEQSGESVNPIKVSSKVETTKDSKKAVKKAVKANKYGVKVGDFFSMDWGYEQTNITHFQVVELVGEASVRVKEVYPEVISTSAQSGMSEDRTYKYDRTKMAPVNPRSVFVKDNDKGDLHRVKMVGSNTPCINFEKGYYTAFLETESTAKHYVSWYA